MAKTKYDKAIVNELTNLFDFLEVNYYNEHSDFTKSIIKITELEKLEEELQKEAVQKNKTINMDIKNELKNKLKNKLDDDELSDAAMDVLCEILIFSGRFGDFKESVEHYEKSDKIKKRIFIFFTIATIAAFVGSCSYGISKNASGGMGESTEDDSEFNTENTEVPSDQTDAKEVSDDTLSEIVNSLNNLEIATNNGAPYIEEEISDIIQFINGSYKAESEEEIYNMMETYRDFMIDIMSSEKNDYKINYLAEFSYATEDPEKRYGEYSVFDFNNLLIGESALIAHFQKYINDSMQAKDKDTFIEIKNKAYSDLATFMYDRWGLQIGAEYYKYNEYFEVNDNISEQVVFLSQITYFQNYSIEGIDKEFIVTQNDGSALLIGLDDLKKQFNSNCEEETFASIVQSSMINSAIKELNVYNK